ncbi:MAG TPA: helix-turn-helix transcriptional regulator [Puia sp.]|nr:helix-turn-helix transcriptional regulator [Puia sp.]
MNNAPIIPIFKFQHSGLALDIQTLQSQTEPENFINPAAHSHDHYEMVWVIRGTGSIRVDLKEYVIRDNHLYGMGPGVVHQLLINPEAEGYILSFTDSFLKMSDHEFDSICPLKLCQLFSEHVVVEIQKDAKPELEEIMVKMANELNHEYSFRTQLLRRYFKIFLIYLIRHLGNVVSFVKQTREIELVKSFMELLDKQFREKKMVADYASLLFVTPNYLNGIVKKNTGFSAGHLIRERVVLEAKRMCRYSDAGMKEIAYELGFVDSSHFSKFFKAVSGMNFSDFKKQGLNYSVLSQRGLTA